MRTMHISSIGAPHLAPLEARLTDNPTSSDTPTPSPIGAPNRVPALSIVILDRGFVLVGDARVDGDWVVTTNASIIRRWGTTKGLGELAANGPLAKTVLDPIGTMRSPLRALIGLVACEPSKWAA